MSPSEPVAFAALDERYERLPIDQIVQSHTNPRTHFDEAYLAELAGSIAEKGVIQPILVRQVDAGNRKPMKFEIIAGECRYRASKLAKQTHIPAVIRQYSDEQVLELQLIENIHRQDLTPLEQAVGYRALITSNPDKHSAASIAQRIGMSEAWVWDRLKLNDLVPEAKAILERGLMTVGHAILIARLKPADQQRTIDTRNGGLFEAMLHGRLYDGVSDPKEPQGKYEDVKSVSIRELEAWIARHVRFDVAHMAKAQPLSFEQTAAAVEQAAAQSGRGKKVIAITFDHGPAEDAKDENERTYGVESWRRADGTKKAPPRMNDAPVCEHSVLGIVTVGRDHYGKAIQVCIARDRCRVHWGKEIAAREKNAKLREQGQTKKAATNEQRQEQSWERTNRLREEARKRWETVKDVAVARVIATIKTAPITTAVLREVIDTLSDDPGTVEIERLMGEKISAKTFTRALAVVQILEQAWSADRFRPIAKKHGIDLAKLEKELAATSAVAPAKKKKAGAAA